MCEWVVKGRARLGMIRGQSVFVQICTLTNTGQLFAVTVGMKVEQ